MRKALNIPLEEFLRPFFGPGGLRVPVRAVLQDPFLRRIVDIDQADALGIAAVPLKIVGRRPVEKLWTSAWSHPLRSASR